MHFFLIVVCAVIPSIVLRHIIDITVTNEAVTVEVAKDYDVVCLDNFIVGVVTVVLTTDKLNLSACTEVSVVGNRCALDVTVTDNLCIALSYNVGDFLNIGINKTVDEATGVIDNCVADTYELESAGLEVFDSCYDSFCNCINL